MTVQLYGSTLAALMARNPGVRTVLGILEVTEQELLEIEDAVSECVDVDEGVGTGAIAMFNPNPGETEEQEGACGVFAGGFGVSAAKAARSLQIQVRECVCKSSQMVVPTAT